MGFDRSAKQLSRRRFLRWTVLGGVTLAGGWRLLSPATSDSFEGLRCLSQAQARTLAAVYSTITLERGREALAAAIGFLDGFVGRLGAREQRELKAALLLVEQSPLLFHGFVARFSALDYERRVRALDGWRLGAGWRRPVFGALKDLCYLHYYTRESSWSAIGYPGPLVRKGAANPNLEKRYEGLRS